MNSSKPIIILVNDGTDYLKIWKDSLSEFLIKNKIQAEIITLDNTLDVPGLLKRLSEQNKKVQLLIMDDYNHGMDGSKLMEELRINRMYDDSIYIADSAGKKRCYTDDLAMLLVSFGSYGPNYRLNPEKEMGSNADLFMSLGDRDLSWAGSIDSEKRRLLEQRMDKVSNFIINNVTEKPSPDLPSL